MGAATSSASSRAARWRTLGSPTTACASTPSSPRRSGLTSARGSSPCSCCHTRAHDSRVQRNMR
eukprot:7807229-Pyramimonas_sp.AAC.2